MMLLFQELFPKAVEVVKKSLEPSASCTPAVQRLKECMEKAPDIVKDIKKYPVTTEKDFNVLLQLKS